MKFKVEISSSINILQAMRRLGYRFLKKDGQEWSFILPLEKRGGYPRLHVYLKKDSKNNCLVFNLHLDQKKPIYKGSAAHGAEYENSLVKNEASRITANLWAEHKGPHSAL